MLVARALKNSRLSGHGRAKAMLATGRDTKIKAGKIRPQEAPSMIVGLNCQVNQYMNSAFLVVDLVGRNADLGEQG